MDTYTNYTGQTLGNYYLTNRIGQGGFADVYLGTHRHLNTKAAIKILQVRLLGANTEQFQQEAQAIASLIHPHIIRVLDFGIQEDIPYLVMDYAPGGTLRGYHPRGEQLTEDTTISYAQQIASALQYAHDRRLIHRDVKPENVLLGPNNELLLSDFGLVLTVQSTRGRTTNEIAGTVAYMAPEQIQGKPRAASDQYALAVMCYEWLSGGPPFQGAPLEVYGQHLHALPPPLRAKAPTVSTAMEQVILRALSKEPEQRFSSVVEFANALAQTKQMPQYQMPLPYQGAQGMRLPSHGAPSASLGVRSAHLDSGEAALTPPRTGTFTPPSQPLAATPWEATMMHTPSQPQWVQQPTPQQNLGAYGSGYHSYQQQYPSQPAFSHMRAPQQQPISRRTMLAGLLGLAVVGGGVAVMGALLWPKDRPSDQTGTANTQSTQTPTASPTQEPTPTVAPTEAPTTAPTPAGPQPPPNVPNGPVTPQTEWRWCSKCMVMAFAGYANNMGPCPAGATHDHTGSGNYKILANSPATGESNWRWCNKCMGLVFAASGNPGVCPAGGGHNWDSWNYSLINSDPNAPGQHGWRICHKCMELFYGGLPNNQGTCPAGGAHDATGSGDYIIESA